MDAPVEQPTDARNGSQHAENSTDAPSPKPKLGRISVKVTPATQAALDRLAEREGVTITEALRRLVGYGDLVYETTQINGEDILIRRGNEVERIRLV